MSPHGHPLYPVGTHPFPAPVPISRTLVWLLGLEKREVVEASLEDLQSPARKLSQRRGRLPSNSTAGSTKRSQVRGHRPQLCWNLPIYFHLKFPGFYSFPLMPYDIRECTRLWSNVLSFSHWLNLTLDPLKKKKRKEGKIEMLIITSPPKCCYVAKLKAKTENPQR